MDENRAHPAIVVAGTDTDVGKTVVSAMLTLALDGSYWKPVQAGISGGTDTIRVQQMTCLPWDRFLPEAYGLSQPLSPHRAAELEGVEINPTLLEALPQTHRNPLVVELAGGLMVPLTPKLLQIDLLARWQAPVVLCARTSLGTINHTLLSLEALRIRKIPLLGVAFVGEAHQDNESIIVQMGWVKWLGRMPFLPRLDPSALRRAFHGNFHLKDFRPKLRRLPVNAVSTLPGG